MVRIEHVLVDLHLDKRDVVREGVAEVTLEIATHNLDLISSQLWNKISLLALDRKERVREAATKTIVETYAKYSTQENLAPEMMAKVHDLRMMLFQIYLKAESLSIPRADVHDRIERAFQKQLLGGRQVKAADRAKRHRLIFISNKLLLNSRIMGLVITYNQTNNSRIN